MRDRLLIIMRTGGFDRLSGKIGERRAYFALSTTLTGKTLVYQLDDAIWPLCRECSASKMRATGLQNPSPAKNAKTVEQSRKYYGFSCDERSLSEPVALVIGFPNTASTENAKTVEQVFIYAGSNETKNRKMLRLVLVQPKTDNVYLNSRYIPRTNLCSIHARALYSLHL